MFRSTPFLLVLGLLAACGHEEKPELGVERGDDYESVLTTRPPDGEAAPTDCPVTLGDATWSVGDVPGGSAITFQGDERGPLRADVQHLATMLQAASNRAASDGGTMPMHGGLPKLDVAVEDLEGGAVRLVMTGPDVERIRQHAALMGTRLQQHACPMGQGGEAGMRGMHGMGAMHGPMHHGGADQLPGSTTTAPGAAAP